MDDENKVGFEFESEFFVEFGDVPIDEVVGGLRRAAAAALTEKRRLESLAKKLPDPKRTDYRILGSLKKLEEVLSGIDRALVSNEEFTRGRLETS